LEGGAGGRVKVTLGSLRVSLLDISPRASSIVAQDAVPYGMSKSKSNPHQETHFRERYRVLNRSNDALSKRHRLEITAIRTEMSLPLEQGIQEVTDVILISGNEKIPIPGGQGLLSSMIPGMALVLAAELIHHKLANLGGYL